MELIAHVVDEFSGKFIQKFVSLAQCLRVLANCFLSLFFVVNIVVVVGSTGLHRELSNRFASEKTSLGEPIQVVSVDQSDGVVKRDEAFLQHSREATIKEYFFGDAKRTLSPQIQQVDFDSLVIYKLTDCKLASNSNNSSVASEQAH
jgi:hypothetical protein